MNKPSYDFNATDQGFILFRYYQAQRHEPGFEPIFFLENALSEAKNYCNTILEYISAEHIRNGQNHLAKNALLEKLKIFPEDCLSYISIANHIFVFEKNINESFEFIDKAIILSRKDGNFFVDSVMSKIRICIEVGDALSIDNLLRDLLNFKFENGMINCKPETKFIEQARQLGVDEDLLSQYSEFSSNSN